MCVYVCVCVCVCIHIYICVCVCVYMYTYIYVCVCVCVCVSVCVYIVYLRFSGGASGPAIAADVRDTSLIPGLGGSPGGGHGSPLQYSCLENHINTGA